MSDSGRQLGDCRHAQTPEWCVTCLREKIARLEAEVSALQHGYALIREDLKSYATDYSTPTFQLVRNLLDESARLRAGLEMLAQIRHVSGNAQAAFRHNLRVIDAILAGKDMRKIEDVESLT